MEKLQLNVPLLQIQRSKKNNKAAATTIIITYTPIFHLRTFDPSRGVIGIRLKNAKKAFIIATE